MIYLAYILISLFAALYAREDKKQALDRKGYITQDRKKFMSYYHASNPKISYEVYTFFVYLASFLIAQISIFVFPIPITFLRVIFGILIWLCAFFIIRGRVRSKANATNYRILAHSEQMLMEMHLQYSATGNFYVAIENVTTHIPIDAMREPLLRYIEKVRKGADPIIEGERAKLHYRTKIMRMLIDAITDAIKQGGRLSSDFQYLSRIAKESAELAKDRKVGSMEITLGVNLSLYLLLGLDLGVAIFKPEVKEHFLVNPFGITILMFTIVAVTWSVISSSVLLSTEDV